ncbi:expressed unknown protein [Seminavis robusta]|uniref:Uncharacterized protein n=1 Tax=Seminavis robusta TaxID=568900 RepID=A0A9N8HFF1_9STRA|nr:expressed unknown protein [Seminavis robusta]|eukprot:Sro567_g167940.1 n/a (146) ;mRNA; f:20033-20470
MESLAFLAVCMGQGSQADEEIPSSSITASQVSFSLQDIVAIPQDPHSIFAEHHDEDIQWVTTRPEFLNGTMVVPLLLLAFLVVSAVLLTILFADDDEENGMKDSLLPKHHTSSSSGSSRRQDVSIRIPIPRRRFVVLETIQEYEP